VAPWLAVRGATDHPTADRRLVEAVDHWECDLLGDELPWYAWEHDKERIGGLSTWLARYAPARLTEPSPSAVIVRRGTGKS
jgi:hypothetical protein